MDAETLVSRINLYREKYCMFVGAGISVCSGVSLATIDLPELPSIVTQIRNDFYESLGYPKLDQINLLKWYESKGILQNPETLYSDALTLIGDNERQRQTYLRKFFNKKQPGICHNSIASLIQLHYFDTIFTTNFDDLLEKAIINNGDCDSPKVAAHRETVDDVLLTELGPKIIKLHGDFLFSDIKNTTKETKTLSKNMRQKLRLFLKEKGIIFIGYSGNDNSIMEVMEKMAYDGGYFPFGIYWLYHAGYPPRSRVSSFLKQVDGFALEINSAEDILKILVEKLEEEK